MSEPRTLRDFGYDACEAVPGEKDHALKVQKLGEPPHCPFCGAYADAAGNYKNGSIDFIIEPIALMAIKQAQQKEQEKP